MSHVRKWWKEGVVYQIYPASFKDTDGDGRGDLPGIISKLDYLKELGVDVIWVSPFYKSPQFDLGYDISDYQDVHAPYGTVADVEKLIEGCHSRGMKVLFDLVINHTSSLHEWFLESRKDKTNPKRDWYIWRKPTVIDGVRHPPCNWRGAFGGSVWEWDEATEEYYLHLFTPEQPDVNWENPELRQALYENAVRFWLDKGCDGFRIDTVNLYSKRLDFPDAPTVDPTTPWQPAFGLFANGPRLHEFLKELYAETFGRYDCMTIGELPVTPDLDQILSYVSAEAKELHMAIQFDLAGLDHGQGRFDLLSHSWKLSTFKEITKKSQIITDPKYKAWAVTYLENHDQARSVTRYASDSSEHRVAASKMLATYLLTLSGTPIIYQGEEIGMKNCPDAWSIEEDYKDVATINQWHEMKKVAAETGDKQLLVDGEKGIRLTARDHGRTPMQWDGSPQAGFSSAKDTWMRVMDSYTEINVASQDKDLDSTLAYYRSLIALRKAHKDIFVYGHFTLFDPENEHTMIFTKKGETAVALVALNFTDKVQPFALPEELSGENWRLAAGSVKHERWLAPFEGRVYISEGQQRGFHDSL